MAKIEKGELGHYSDSPFLFLTVSLCKEHNYYNGPEIQNGTGDSAGVNPGTLLANGRINDLLCGFNSHQVH